MKLIIQIPCLNEAASLPATLRALPPSLAGITKIETLFIDDLAANIATASELGFQTHHYHPDRHHELLAALDTHGIA